MLSDLESRSLESPGLVTIIIYLEPLAPLQVALSQVIEELVPLVSGLGALLGDSLWEKQGHIHTELFLLWGLAFLNEDNFGWVSDYSTLIPGWRLLSHPSFFSPILRATQVAFPSRKKYCSKESNMSLSCRLQWAGCVIYPLCWRLLARPCTPLESTGKWALSFICHLFVIQDK